ncbi:MAG: alpha/beta hydrolase fold domain-containing protein [Opitutae bacterium]|nr:alpha/beta hydrolase fold domain-containing protein [Opitutae bacterium]
MRHPSHLFSVCRAVVLVWGLSAVLACVEARPVRLMAVGDSITAGADFFSCYRYPLWEKLFAAGYVVEFVGTQTSETRVGPLAHEGYGGKNTEFLAQAVPAHFREHPADVVLLHSGHNHSVEEQPVAAIVAATERLIAAFRAVNPRVTVLLAQVIPAGKLPKYSYLPALNQELAALAKRLDRSAQRVMLVDQATGFDWTTDTVADKVHPNARGAAKMAETWFRALRGILPPPAQAFAPRRIAYERVGETELQLHVFDAAAAPATATRAAGTSRARPAILFFFGGGWTHGTPIQFYPECAHFAARGFVAISADYRIASAHDATPFDAAHDARAAVRWIRAHAAELGVDPERIVAAGASAGGHLAAASALAGGDEDGAADQRSVSARPNALLLLYPVLDTSAAGYGHALFGERFAELSPLEAMNTAPQRLPPTLIMVGDADRATPVATAKRFAALAQAAGRRCEVVVFPGGGHPLYSYRDGGEPGRSAVLAEADRFLASMPGFAPVH